MKIYLTFHPYIWTKYNFYFTDLHQCEYVFYFYNMGFNYYNEELQIMWTNNEDAFSSNREFNNINYFLKMNKKVILYYRSDSSDHIEYLNNYHNEIINKNIILIKDFSVDINYFIKNNIEKIEIYGDNGSEGYNTFKIMKIFNEINIENKTNKYIAKNQYDFYDKYIHIWTWKFNAYGFLYMNYDKNNEINNKPIDVFYVKNYRENTIDCLYRKKIHEIINQMKLKYKNLNFYTEPCNSDIYLDKLSKAKICVSCYGMGECCYDDWKSIINNTILVKPDTSYVKDYYGINNEFNEMINFFSIDLSDLETKIIDILNNYDIFKQKAIIAKQKLLQFDEEKHVKDFCKIFN